MYFSISLLGLFGFFLVVSLVSSIVSAEIKAGPKGQQSPSSGNSKSNGGAKPNSVAKGPNKNFAPLRAVPKNKIVPKPPNSKNKPSNVNPPKNPSPAVVAITTKKSKPANPVDVIYVDVIKVIHDDPVDSGKPAARPANALEGYQGDVNKLGQFQWSRMGKGRYNKYRRPQKPVTTVPPPTGTTEDYFQLDTRRQDEANTVHLNVPVRRPKPSYASNGKPCPPEEISFCWDDGSCPWWQTCKTVNCVTNCHPRSGSEWHRVK